LLIFYILFFKLVLTGAKLNTIVEIKPNKGEFEIEIILNLQITKKQLEYFIK